MNGVKKWGKVGGSGIYTSIHRTIFSWHAKVQQKIHISKRLYQNFFYILSPFVRNYSVHSRREQNFIRLQL
jgi:hypothetical protein